MRLGSTLAIVALLTAGCASRNVECERLVLRSSPSAPGFVLEASADGETLWIRNTQGQDVAGVSLNQAGRREIRVPGNPSNPDFVIWTGEKGTAEVAIGLPGQEPRVRMGMAGQGLPMIRLRTLIPGDSEVYVGWNMDLTPVQKIQDKTGRTIYDSRQWAR